MTNRLHLPLMLTLLTCMLSACSNSTSVSLKQNKAFPIPLVEAYPLNVGSYYSPEFISYTYLAEAKRTTNGKTKVVAKTEVALGEPQINMFNSVLRGMFTSVTPVTSIAPGEIPSNLDAIVIPTVVDFQYANPRVTRQNVYEIWIKYRIRLLASDGSTAYADFTLPAYGKTPSAMMQSAEAAINAAAIVALRDVGASLISRFEREPDVKSWLQEKNILSATEE